ncbi:hypothetical protein M1K46_16290 [Fictibacillus sp. WQ 8-8]|uniref:hypothetical protein n=1 Tax=unclassified Fictibacillus TaxID=2644029 RepID=UPI000785557A|nr:MULTISPECIES: hypothetical protein [unclassified Fictibacillus]MCQ6267199.1 hypothetical protein [Fictibacillus sp. WQ 8-8]UZJ77008.1 hypothetical protein OKX00_12395 [Fictibacillus sp. KU28468]SFD90712.1 hypothetical protein SAMN05428981_102267 [Bacillus sp. OV194]
MHDKSPGSHLFKIPRCSIQNDEFQIVSQYYESEYLAYRTFIVSKLGTPYLLYELGITYGAAYELNQSYPLHVPAFLLPLGLNFVYEMLAAPCPPHCSSLITKQHITSLTIHWSKLPPITDHFTSHSFHS